MNCRPGAGWGRAGWGKTEQLSRGQDRARQCSIAQGRTAHRQGAGAGAGALPISEQQHIIKDGIDLRRGLQKANHGGQAHDVGGVGQELGHTVGGSTVQPCADLIHQQHTLQYSTICYCCISIVIVTV